MLKGYLYLSDDKKTWLKLPDPESYSVKPEKAEDILTAESGRTIKVVRSSRKVTVSCTFCLTDAWVNRLAAWNDKTSFYLKYYDDLSKDDCVIECYADGWAPELIRESVNHKDLKGAWNCSLDFREL